MLNHYYKTVEFQSLPTQAKARVGVWGHKEADAGRNAQTPPGSRGHSDHSVCRISAHPGTVVL